jgi:hypothetical protein
MKPIVLTAEQRKEIERRRKETLDRRIYTIAGGEPA